MSDDTPPPGRRAPRKPRRPPPPVTAASLERSALGYLQRFATSSGHLRRLLMTKVERSVRDHGDGQGAVGREQAAAWIDALIAKLDRLKLLDDALYAESKARSLHRKGQPRAAIAQVLAAKRLDADHTAAALAALAAEVGGDRQADLRAAIAYAKRRRLGPFRTEGERAARREKDLAALARRGFSRDIASRVLTADSAEALTALLENQDDAF